MGELLVLDPQEVASGRTELDLTEFVAQDGPDFGEAAIEQYLADQGVWGQVPVDFRVPLRTVTIPLVLRAADGMTFEQARRIVQAKTALIQREGGILKRQTAAGVLYADIVRASLKLGARTHAAWGIADTDAVLTLECLPDWWGPAVELDTIAETTRPEIAAVLTKDGQPAVIAGDYPARCVVVVEDDSGNDQRTLLVAFRSRNHSSAPTAALAFDATALTLQGAASVTPDANAFGGQAVTATLSAVWAPMLLTDVAGVGPMTHTGRYRVLVRARSTGSVRLRLSWAVGAFRSLATNSGRQVIAGGYRIIDLGEINIERLPAGSHSWIGLIEASSAVTGAAVFLDRIWLEPLDESSTRIVPPPQVNAEPGAPGVAYDTFTAPAAAALNGRTADAGGTWTTSGSTGDFTAGPYYLQRAQANDSSSTTAGRIALLGTSALTGITAAASMQLQATVSGQPCMVGFVLRYVDANNMALCRLQVQQSTSPGTTYRIGPIVIDAVVGGTRTTIAMSGSTTVPISGIVPWLELRCHLFADGTFRAQVTRSPDTAPALTLSGWDSVFAPAGALASGRFGLSDFWPASTSAQRLCDWVAFAPAVAGNDAAVFGGQATRLHTSGVVRLDTTGAGSPAPRVLGTLPRIPPSGAEGRPVELFVKASRGDLDTAADSGIDDISAKVIYHPCWLITPGA